MKIAYVRNTFPKSTETFILEEILYLASLGHHVRIYASRCELGNMNPKLPGSGMLDHVVYADEVSSLPVSRKLRMVRIFLQRYLRHAPYRNRYRRNYFPNRDLKKELSTLIARQAGRKSFMSALAMRVRSHWTVWLSSMKLHNLSLAISQFLLAATEFTPDHIHCPFLFAKDCEKMEELRVRYPAVPYTVTLRSRDLYLNSEDKDYLSRRNELIDQATRVFAISEYNKREIGRRYVLDNPVEVVHSSIDTDYFRPSLKPGKKMRQMICVARLVPKKGLELLIDACANLHKSGEDFHLSIVGGGVLKAALLERIGNYGLQAKVEIVGPYKIDMIRYLLNQAEVFVLPCVVAEDGDRDMLPNSLKEAMAMRLVVVTTNISGIDELITDEVDGLLVEPNSAVDLAEKMRRAYSDKKFARRAGEKAREKVKASFSIQVEGKKFGNALDRIHARSFDVIPEIDTARKQDALVGHF